MVVVTADGMGVSCTNMAQTDAPSGSVSATVSMRRERTASHRRSSRAISCKRTTSSASSSSLFVLCTHSRVNWAIKLQTFNFLFSNFQTRTFSIWASAEWTRCGACRGWASCWLAWPRRWSAHYCYCCQCQCAKEDGEEAESWVRSRRARRPFLLGVFSLLTKRVEEKTKTKKKNLHLCLQCKLVFCCHSLPCVRTWREQVYMS